MGLHVRMRDSLGNILKFELFHVPIVGSVTGSEHPISAREHADPGDHIPNAIPSRLKVSGSNLLPCPAKVGSPVGSSEFAKIGSGIPSSPPGLSGAAAVQS